MTVVNGSFVFPRARTFHSRAPQDFFVSSMTQMVWNLPETWKHAPLEIASILWTSFPSRSGSSNLKAFVCLFVQPIYFDYTVYSSEEGKTYLKQRASHNETILYGSLKFVNFGKKGSGNGVLNSKTATFYRWKFQNVRWQKLIALCLKTVRFG